MDENEVKTSQEQENQEFSLEDIMKEFSPSGQEEEEQITVAPTPKGKETPVQVQELEDPSMLEDTVRMPAIQGSQMAMGMGDTIRVGVVSEAEQEEETEEEPPVIPTEPEKAEPFSEDWEPEYEQPIGEYVPPQPIVFRPRSKAHELKRKLVSGPERRYYELSEKGVGKTQVAILVCLLVVLLSAGAMVMYVAGLVPDSRLKLMVFSQFFAMLICALMGCYRMMEGAADLFKGRFTLNTMLLVTFLVCCIDGVLGLVEQRISCCAAFGLQVIMSLLNDYHCRSSHIGMMDVLRKASHLERIARVADYHDGSDGLLRSEGEPEDFMENYEEEPAPDKTLSVYALVALGVSLLVGAVAGVVHLSVSFGVRVLTVSLLASMPVTAFIATSRPSAILTKKLHKLGAVLCGWQGVEAMNGNVVFPIGHDDLFPTGACKLNGVKFYGERDPDEVVAFCSALVLAEGGGLAPLFDYLLTSRNGRHHAAMNLRAYPGGIGGEVCGESVLMGELELLKEMGVEIPDGISVSQAVYAAIDGELSGVFAVSYDKVKSSAAGIQTLSAYRGLRTVLTSGDFMLTEEFLRGRFNINTRRICFPERSERAALEAIRIPEDAVSAALITSEGLAPFAYAVTGARALRTAAKLGTVLTMLGGILGLVMMLVLAILGAEALLTPVNMFAYQLVWLVPGLLLTEWTRNI